MTKLSIIIKYTQELAQKELDELEINYAETGRDRELDYPDIKEEERICFLESVIDGDMEVINIYIKNTICSDCKISLSSNEYCDKCRNKIDHERVNKKLESNEVEVINILDFLKSGSK